ncbi:class I SAM-dependent methyltransferase [Candidatus Methylacidithermus pantelleriae]|uniref:Putative Methyltransf_25 domain-containing protein n=1 Tax=Candidatus Methylacidithermus pantelleriae TaxID=2744239 RepID=A0A8J2FRV7_9BACT|nr:class I SAM-dependent methyltransferase [Candidatus Methylacidithermus pantelleriae]CAF0694414.1 putative Methyltransf_25 domain-containing protein [Candidatus Methylacidithermus pantelleriae]
MTERSECYEKGGERENVKVAEKVAKANREAYERLDRERYIVGAFHIRQEGPKRVWLALWQRVQAHLPEKKRNDWELLDLGAGEGSMTLSWLERGARVTAIDISQRRLEQLGERCKRFQERLTLIEGDASEWVVRLKELQKTYDVVAVSAFLHHVPDYLLLVESFLGLVGKGGQVITFEDPLWRPRLGWTSTIMDDLLYAMWRVSQPDPVGGAFRWLRRKCGIFRDTPEDWVEYHGVRWGVDEEKIVTILERSGFEWEMYRYFSTPGKWEQRVGESLGLVNRFALWARRTKSVEGLYSQGEERLPKKVSSETPQRERKKGLGSFQY